MASESDRVSSTIARLLRDGSMVAEADGSAHDVRAVSISPGEGEAQRRWVLREQAANTIEIVALDPFQAGRFANCGLQVLREAGVASLVEHHDEMSQIVLPAFLGQGRRFDLAFVDGNHRFDAVFLDLFYLGRLLPRGGVIVLDDYDLPGIRRAVSFHLANLGWQVEEVSPPDDPHQWVVLRTATTEDTRDFRYFVEF